jgi:hypothetical protein
MTTLKSKLLFTMLASLFVTAMAALVPTVEGSSVTVASASTAPPLCQGGWLWAAYQGSAGTTGNIIYSIDIINDTHHTCRLAGYPTIQGYRDGAPHNVPLAHHGTYAGNLRPTVLTYRMSGLLLMSVSDECNAANTGGQTKIRRLAAAHTYTNLTLGFPGGGSVQVNGITLDTVCGLDVSQLGWNVING